MLLCIVQKKEYKCKYSSKSKYYGENKICELSIKLLILYNILIVVNRYGEIDLTTWERYMQKNMNKIKEVEGKRYVVL